MDLKNYIRDIQDYPKEGIVFKDLTPLWKDKDALKYTIETMASFIKDKNVDLIIGAESRGFMVGAALALYTNTGFIPVRKPGKLPYKTISATYELEYGTDTLYMHEDAISKADNVYIVDDLIATGGTACAMVELSETLGANIVGLGFVVELAFLNGREDIKKYPINSIITY